MILAYYFDSYFARAWIASAAVVTDLVDLNDEKICRDGFNQRFLVFRCI